MTPGTSPSPGENRESLDQRPDEATNHGEQARYTRKFCEKKRHEPRGLQGLIDEYHKGTKTKNNLRDAFKVQLRSSDPAERARMGFMSAAADPTDTEIETFLSQTQCFENQLMAQIETDARAKNRAQETQIESCLEVAHDEYGNFDENELKNELKKEGMSRLKTFLENPKYRKTYISKLPGGRALKEKTFSDINFDEISRNISKLNATNPKRREIQEAWLKIAQVAHPEKNLAEAFSNITHEGGPQVDIAGAYDAFFSDENTLVSKENREKILNFLTRQYVPTIPLLVLDTIDPKTSKTFLLPDTEKAEFTKDLPTDPLLAAAIKKDKEEYWEKVYRASIGGGKTFIGTRSLPFETKIRILSQFGSIGNAEKMLEYYRGNPASLRKSTDGEDDFRKTFQDYYNGLDPEKLDTKSGLLEELTVRLGHRVEGLEHFSEGCVMQWKTKNDKQEDITGYFIIDTIPSEDPDEDNIITARFLGNSSGPFSPGGLARYYTGADFYHYLDGCAEDGSITFRKRDEFDSEIEANTTAKKLPRYFTDEETHAELRNQFPDSAEVQSKASLDYEIDQILNPRNNNPKEAKTPKERALHPGMIFTKITEGRIDTFQILDIDEDDGKITLWDGWGDKNSTSPKNKSRKEMSFTEFAMTIRNLKQKSKELYRLPIGGKTFGIKEFNQLCLLETQYDDGTAKKMKQVAIQENDGENIFGKIDTGTGNFSAMPVIKIGDKKDLFIESISGTTVTYRRGSFTQGNYDKEKDKWTQQPGFSGSPELTMSLEMLWAYLHSNPTFTFEKPIEKAQKKEPENSGNLSWWNILMHTHSLGVILHGDLWNAPFKAWEEQHHKDHAFAGKMTAALAAEKLQRTGGPLGSLWNHIEFPSLMVADGNSSFHSYLDELIQKIDGMGSYHRTKLIKKWSKKEHFPSVKFMAAMCASMQIFGKLYPYDYGKDDYKDPHTQSHEWFWYNSISHSLGHAYPHMPPHHGEPWPDFLLDPGKNKMTEVQACQKLFNSFQHPILKNLGRRFQKYANGGQEKLASGGKGNLNERTTMEGKLEWMLSAIISPAGKPPEAFGEATELWLKEGYPTAISTMPYAALLFGCGEQNLLPATQEHIKKQFQDEGCHIPMFVFMQSKDLGDTFRETSIAFAYTIGKNCGDKLQKLVDTSSHERLSGERYKDWIKSFTSFWKDYGKDLMHKLSGMRDPMLNLMINDQPTFNKLLDAQTGQKKADYERLNKNKNIVRAYYDRLINTYDSPSHTGMPRDKGFYSGDHFRFRDNFDSGYPIAWVNWDAYLDQNLDDGYSSQGKATSGDGIFNEIRGFFYKIPEMAEKMAENMGFKGDTEKINEIAKAIFEKNVAKIKPTHGIEKILATNPAVEYCSMTAMMLGLIDVKQLSQDAAPEKVARFTDYKKKMLESVQKAKTMENDGNYCGAIKYRAEMAAKWSLIVKGETKTQKLSLKDIENSNDPRELDDNNIDKVKKYTQSRSGATLAKDLTTFEGFARRGKNATATAGGPERTAAESDDLPLAA